MKLNLDLCAASSSLEGRDPSRQQRVGLRCYGTHVTGGQIVAHMNLREGPDCRPHSHFPGAGYVFTRPLTPGLTVPARPELLSDVN
jgi:hypothetical protein